jgi:hypothetical protein
MRLKDIQFLITLFVLKEIFAGLDQLHARFKEYA